MLVAAITLSFSVAACAGDGEPVDTSPSPTQVPAASERWLAAVEVAPRADDLDGATERLRDLLGPALVVSPVDCFDGLPTDAGEGYVIGAIADSDNAAELLVVEAGEPVLFTASVTILCSD